MMLNIVLTFDYELFFGKNFYSEEETLFKPTEEIVALLTKYKVSSTFYVDVCSVFAYKQQVPESKYCTNFKNQILYLSNNNQDVQLHIHPHWMTARYGSGKWMIDEKAYRLHHFLKNGEKIKANEIVEKGILYLENIIRETDKNYKCISYRAGGFCLQPIDEMIGVLKANNIQIDSSVAMMQRLKSNVHFYDYIREYDELNWDIGNGIYEVPIGAVKNSLVKRIIYGSKYKSLNRNITRGTAIHTSVVQKNNYFKYLFNYGKTYKVMTLDSMPYRQLVSGLNVYYKQYNCENRDSTVAILCHPKMVDDIILDNMKRFIDSIISDNKKFRFLSIRQLYEIKK